MQANENIKLERENLRAEYYIWTHMNKKGLQGMKKNPTNDDKKEFFDGFQDEINALYQIRDKCDILIKSLNKEKAKTEWN